MRTSLAGLNKVSKIECPGNSRAMSEDREENSWVEGRERILRRNETSQLRVQQARSLVVVEEVKGPGEIDKVPGG